MSPDAGQVVGCTAATAQLRSCIGVWPAYSWQWPAHHSAAVILCQDSAWLDCLRSDLVLTPANSHPSCGTGVRPLQCDVRHSQTQCPCSSSVRLDQHVVDGAYMQCCLMLGLHEDLQRCYEPIRLSLNMTTTMEQTQCSNVSCRHL